MTIHDMTLADYSVYARMAKALYGGDACLYPITEAKLRDTLTESLREGALTRLLLFQYGNRPIGYANLSYTWSTEAGGRVCWIEELYFEPDARGQGHAHAFFEWCRQTHPDVKRFRLEVSPQNARAARLYERLGYQKLDYQSYVIDRE